MLNSLENHPKRQKTYYLYQPLIGNVILQTRHLIKQNQNLIPENNLLHLGVPPDVGVILEEAESLEHVIPGLDDQPVIPQPQPPPGLGLVAQTDPVFQVVAFFQVPHLDFLVLSGDVGHEYFGSFRVFGVFELVDVLLENVAVLLGVFVLVSAFFGVYLDDGLDIWETFCFF